MTLPPTYRFWNDGKNGEIENRYYDFEIEQIIEEWRNKNHHLYHGKFPVSKIHPLIFGYPIIHSLDNILTMLNLISDNFDEEDLHSVIVTYQTNFRLTVALTMTLEYNIIMLSDIHENGNCNNPVTLHTVPPGQDSWCFNEKYWRMKYGYFINDCRNSGIHRTEALKMYYGEDEFIPNLYFFDTLNGTDQGINDVTCHMTRMNDDQIFELLMDKEYTLTSRYDNCIIPTILWSRDRNEYSKSRGTPDSRSAKYTIAFNNIKKSLIDKKLHIVNFNDWIDSIVDSIITNNNETFSEGGVMLDEAIQYFENAKKIYELIGTDDITKAHYVASFGDNDSDIESQYKFMKRSNYSLNKLMRHIFSMISVIHLFLARVPRSNKHFTIGENSIERHQ